MGDAIATYRLQLTPTFGFEAARRVAPNLARLGISHLYLSPIFDARRGSEHGYDVTDPTRIRPEFGGEDGFRALASEAQRLDMEILIDIVPNHMAAHPENERWCHVLENGPASQFADWFDIRWGAGPANPYQVLLPILGAPLDEALAAGEITLALGEDGLRIEYYEWSLPLTPGSWSAPMSRAALIAVDNGQTEAARTLRQLAAEAEAIPDWRNASEQDRRSAAVASFKRSARSVLDSSEDARRCLQRGASQFGQDADDRGSLQDLLSAQPYRLEYWRITSDVVPYRRFFDINDLVCVRQEDERVFEGSHALILRLAEEGLIGGVRVDHVDGLSDPQGYLRRLREALDRAVGASSSPARIFVEKILIGDEALRHDWSIEGATGYEFLNAVNQTLIDPAGAQRLRRYYAEATDRKEPFTALVRKKKSRAAETLFGGELRELAVDLTRLAQNPTSNRALDEDTTTEALRETASCLSVYRTYIRPSEMIEEDRRLTREAVEMAKARCSSLGVEACEFLRDVLLGMNDESSGEDDADPLRERFVRRWQQFTGPLAAKGMEDTALYCDAALISMNEVGADPASFDQPRGSEALHRLNENRLGRFASGLSATSTHDTKRDEDVRARLHALSEFAEEWSEAARRWMARHSTLKRDVGGKLAPSLVDELFIYQTLLGAWPVDDADISAFRDRVQRCMVKAAREAKERTSWREPNEEYEQALQAFVAGVMPPEASPDFFGDFAAWRDRLAFFGAINSLSQVVLKIASPGVPDFYQGSELWSLSLVDPDNRRPVDFDKRRKMLDRFSAEDDAPLHARLLDDRGMGAVKMLTTWRGLRLRRLAPRLFRQGECTALRADEPRRDHVVALARRLNDQWAAAIVPRMTASLTQPPRWPIGADVWDDAALPLPSAAPSRWINTLTGERIEVVRRKGENELRLRDVFATFPAALLSNVERGWSE